MRIWRGVSHVYDEAAPCVVAVSDIAQLGHDRSIWSGVAEARRLGVACVLLLLTPQSAKPADIEAALSPLGGLGIDAICVQPRTAAPTRPAWDEPAIGGIVSRLNVLTLVLGAGAVAGEEGRLAALAQRTGVTVNIVGELAELAPDRLSPTHVRDRLLAGDVATAAAVLGCPHRVTGTVVRGEGRGRGLGFPTANIALDAHAVVPADGIYAGWFTVVDKGWSDGDMVGGISYPAAVSIGWNPTFSGRQRTVEPHVLDASANLYGQEVTTDFVERVRATERFDSIEELVAAMRRDIEQVHSILSDSRH